MLYLSIVLKGSDDTLIKRWRVSDGLLLRSFRGHLKEITDITLSPEEDRLASSSLDHTVKVWNVETGECLFNLEHATKDVLRLKWCKLQFPDCEKSLLFTSSIDGCCRVYHGQDLAESCSQFGSVGIELNCIAVEPKSCLLALAYSNGRVIIWSLSQLKEISAFTVNHEVNWLEFSPSGMELAIGPPFPEIYVALLKPKKDGVLQIEHLNFSSFLSFPRHLAPYSTCADWSVDGSFLAVGTSSGGLLVMTSKLSLITHQKSHSDYISSIAFHPVLNHVCLSSGHDGTTILWRIDTNAIVALQRFDRDDEYRLYTCCWSLDGSFFASSSDAGRMILFKEFQDPVYENYREEQFFQEDYRPLMHDQRGFPIDLELIIPPNLIPRVLCNHLLIPYENQPFEYSSDSLVANSFVELISLPTPAIFAAMPPNIGIEEHISLPSDFEENEVQDDPDWRGGSEDEDIDLVSEDVLGDDSHSNASSIGEQSPLIHEEDSTETLESPEGVSNAPQPVLTTATEIPRQRRRRLVRSASIEVPSSEDSSRSEPEAELEIPTIEAVDDLITARIDSSGGDNEEEPLALTEMHPDSVARSLLEFNADLESKKDDSKLSSSESEDEDEQRLVYQAFLLAREKKRKLSLIESDTESSRGLDTGPKAKRILKAGTAVPDSSWLTMSEVIKGYYVPQKGDQGAMMFFCISERISLVFPSRP
jgi:hypothetical protein